MEIDTISLRSFRPEDSSRLAQLANNPKIAYNLRDGFPHSYSITDAEKYISINLSQNHETNFAIEYNGEYVGNIGLVLGSDVYCKSAELGYFIGEPYWNKGIASEAIRLITQYAFDTLHLIRIHSDVFEYNAASMRVLSKCGFTLEAISKKALWKKDQVWDEYKYALINPKHA